VLLAGGLFLLRRGGGGSGTGGGTSSSDPLYAAVLTAMDHKAAGSLGGRQTRCMAQAVIDAAGRDRLIEQGVTKGADPVLAVDAADKDAVIHKALDCLDDRAMVAFMAATWTDRASGSTVAIGPCVFKGWLQRLGRDRMAYLYSSYASVDPPPLDKALNPNEYKVATRVINDCGPTGSSTTAAP